MLDRHSFITGSSSFLAEHGPTLAQLHGQRITASWVAWDLENDEWWPDEAIVLEVGDTRLELVFVGLDTIALTTNEIDLTRKPRWVSDWPATDLEWRRDALPALQTSAGTTIREVRVVEYRYRTERLFPRRWWKRKTSAWLLNGIQLDLDAGHLFLFNALDEAGVSDQPASGPDIRTHTVRS